MTDKCRAVMVHDEGDAKKCDAIPGCVADRIHKACLDIPDCSRYMMSNVCEQQPGCFFDGSSCQQNGLTEKPNISYARFATKLYTPPSEATRRNDKPTLQKHAIDRRMTHLCAPYDTIVPTMLASNKRECRYPCEDFDSFEECSRLPGPSRMCEWKNDKCNVLPGKYDIVDKRTMPSRFADLLHQRSTSLVFNPNVRARRK